MPRVETEVFKTGTGEAARLSLPDKTSVIVEKHAGGVTTSMISDASLGEAWAHLGPLFMRPDWPGGAYNDIPVPHLEPISERSEIVRRMAAFSEDQDSIRTLQLFFSGRIFTWHGRNYTHHYEGVNELEITFKNFYPKAFTTLLGLGTMTLNRAKSDIYNAATAFIVEGLQP